MLAAQRRDLLLERLRVDGRIVAKDLAAEVSQDHEVIDLVARRTGWRASKPPSPNCWTCARSSVPGS